MYLGVRKKWRGQVRMFRVRRGVSPLWDALLNGHVAEATRIVSSPGADEAVLQLHEGKTPMQALSENARLAKPDLFFGLLSAGAVVDDTCLYRACFKQNVAAVRLLLAAKREGKTHFNVNIVHPTRHTTPLFVSVENENPAICEALLQDADIDPNAGGGITALYLAASMNIFDIVELLLAHPRTDPNLGLNGTAPLHIATYKNNIRTVRMLVANPSVNPWLHDAFDMTALDLAKRLDHAELVALLSAIPAPPTAALTTAPTRHAHGGVVPKIMDFITLEETNITDYDDSYMIFKIGDSYFARTKESIRKDIDDEDGDRILFECRGELHGAPTRDQIHGDQRYFVLSGNGNYVVPLDQILGALNHPTNTFEIVGPMREMGFVASYSAIIVDGDIGFKRRPVNIVSRDHCQADTAKQLYEIHPLLLSAAVGGSRRGRRTRRRRTRHIRGR